MYPQFKFKFIVQSTFFKQRCHPEWNEAESRDPGTEYLLKWTKVRRSFDVGFAFAQDDSCGFTC